MLCAVYAIASKTYEINFNSLKNNSTFAIIIEKFFDFFVLQQVYYRLYTVLQIYIIYL